MYAEAVIKPRDDAPLSEIATAFLPVLAALKPHPLDAPIPIFIGLGALAEALEKRGKKELANQVTVLSLAVAPVPDHATRPEKLDVFATYLIDQIETAFRGFME